MDKHTPGPWTVEGPLVKVESEHGVVAVIATGTLQAASPIGVIRANARLIAAAPDLLAACEQAIYALKGREHDGFLRDAIKKAKGQ